MAETYSFTALWWAVIASGIYHGLNPGMGWPLAVSAALMERKPKALATALAALAFGHFMAMSAILLPFSLLATLVQWEDEIRIGAGALVIGFGIYLLINRRHPRALARIKPTQLVLWSFMAAMVHGAGLMLVPIFLGLHHGTVPDSGHEAAGVLMTGTAAVFVAIIHTLAMMVAGGIIAAIIYFWLGLRFLSRMWFNLDVVWALSLILVGAAGIYGAGGHH